MRGMVRQRNHQKAQRCCSLFRLTKIRWSADDGTPKRLLADNSCETEITQLHLKCVHTQTNTSRNSVAVKNQYVVILFFFCKFFYQLLIQLQNMITSPVRICSWCKHGMMILLLLFKTPRSKIKRIPVLHGFSHFNIINNNNNLGLYYYQIMFVFLPSMP